MREPRGYMLAAIRKDFPVNAYGPLISWICSQPFSGTVLGNPFPPARENWLAQFAGPDAIGASREIRWCTEYLLQYTDRLRDYLDLRTRLERAFLSSETELCFELLDKVKEDLGVSYWLIKTRISYLEHFYGLEAQKKFTGKIKVVEESGSAVRFIAHYASVRAEGVGSALRFQRQFRSTVANFDVDEGLSAYLRFHILGDTTSREDILGEILRYECGGSAIDQYETLLAVARMVIAGEVPSLYRPIISTLHRFRAQLPDPRIHKLLLDLDPTFQEVIQPDDVELEGYRLFRAADYDAGYRLLDQKLLTDPCRPIALYLAALCLAGSTASDSPDKTFRTIISLLRHAIRAGAEADDSLSALTRIAWALDGSAIAALIRGVMAAELSPAVIPAKSDIARFLVPAVADLHPIQLRWLANPVPGAPPISRCPHDQFRSAAAPDELAWIRMSDALMAGKFDSALAHARKLQSSVHPHYQRLAIRAIPFCLLKTGQYAEAITATVDSFMADNGLLELLPVHEIVESIPRDKKREVEGSLSYVILCEMYHRLVGPQAHHILRFAYEDFLFAHKTDRPSKLQGAWNGAEKRKFIFFLRVICVEAVMDTSIAFESSSEVSRERIDVCHLLTKLDPSKSAQYLSETREILRRLAVKAQLREIEQSKIRVDLDSVRNAARRELQDGFARYKFLQANSMSDEEKAAVETARERVMRGDPTAMFTLEVPQNERTALLESLFTVVRDEFVSSNEHGLDGYLSVRIRHGTFEGQLRSPLEADSLLTKRDPKTKVYKGNRYWAERLGIEAPSQEKELFQAFNKFSGNFDKLVEKILGEWFQVKKLRADKGLFDISILGPEVHIINADIGPETTPDEFIEPALGYFMQRLEKSLTVVRDHLQNQAKPEILRLLTELQADIQKCERFCNTAPLQSAISLANTNVQVTVDRITDWFRVPKAEKKQPFEIEAAIIISAQNVRSVCPDFQVETQISEDVQNLAIEGSAMSFIDILDLAFSNVVKHSGISGKVTAKVFASLESSNLVIRIANPVAGGTATDIAKAAVEATVEKVRAQPFSSAVATEGGTGFSKIQKILHHDFGVGTAGTSAAPLSAGFLGDDSFFLEFGIPLRSIGGDKVTA